MPSSRVGWQPSRFLTDRAEAKRDFALAERLGSITKEYGSSWILERYLTWANALRRVQCSVFSLGNATAAELGTSWPLLRRSLGTVR
jgi:hypothetical protein